MKKLLGVLMLTLFLVGCSSGGGNDITVVSREDGSGTRGAFIELLGIEEKDANGNKKDLTTVEAVIANKTDVMLSNISNDPAAIGYLSLGSLNDSIKGLQIDGVDPTVANIVSGDYKVARPFNIVLGSKTDDVTEDFIKFILSTDGQSVVETVGYIAVNTTEAYTPVNLSGKIVVAGSSSVSPVMEKLAESYMAINSNVTIEIQTTDSTAGVQAAIDGTANIGMASRELKDEESAQVEGIVIGIDGIVVVVNNDNKVTNLSSELVKNIFIGKTVSWDEVAGE